MIITAGKDKTMEAVFKAVLDNIAKADGNVYEKYRVPESGFMEFIEKFNEKYEIEVTIRRIDGEV